MTHRSTDHVLNLVTKKVKGFERAYIVHCGFQPRLMSTLGWLPVDTTLAQVYTVDKYTLNLNTLT